MMTTKVLTVVLALIVLFTGAAQAAPLSVTLVRTSGPFNDDPPGAPLPLGRVQYDAGNVLLSGQKVAEYLRAKPVNSAGQNTAAVSLTIFIANPSGAPTTLTLLGGHDFNTGNQSGSISATSLPTSGIVGVNWTLNGTTNVLTINFP